MIDDLLQVIARASGHFRSDGSEFLGGIAACVSSWRSPLALGPDTLPTMLIGYGLILLALVFYAPLIGSSVQRIVGDDVSTLDEFQLRLRGRALGLAYAAFAGLTLLVVLYAAIASDKGGWFPNSYEAFNGVFWGVFLYASILPTALLSWLIEPSFASE